MDAPTLGTVLQAFFEDYLKLQKGLRPHSVRSYRDSLRLLLLFASEQLHCKITSLTLDDLTADLVCRFLGFLEERRAYCPQSRNQRLAALRSFFEFVARTLPDKMAHAQQVLAIPRKRAQAPETVYLERAEIEELFSTLPNRGRLALRDRALLLFLYNTGARVQEVSDLRRSDIQFDQHSYVRLHGKGDKWRVCPLWKETVSLLRRMTEVQHAAGALDGPVFCAANGRALTRFGIYKIVRRYTQHIRKPRSNGQNKNISPHIFRHSTAVHLLESGVEVNVIRGWLGHVNLETTNRYAEITIRMKQKALELCEPPVASLSEFPRRPIWRNDTLLLNWLQSL